ncbi:membrane protein insertion efficiency factor YidD [Vibrio rarus]|uniref:membrane protein insertion efficiency factor YidD n=1 Tax=Vibrio rarus TaxID=413403 RepID=UPI0021C33C31|nr:membrane protein insertion efficiency factor YidD [Vibrio rarus]
MAKTFSPLAWIAVGLVYLYRVGISPFIGPRCRFTPTCSEYAILALKSHGFVKGCWLSGKRLLKCHPYNDGGYDPVPPNNTTNRDK